MGSPLSATIANLVMENLETNCISKLSFSLPFYKRYVDDIITAIKIGDSNELLNCFNNYHNKLKFTIEFENNNELNFLDIKIIKSNNGDLICNWYNKPTCSYRYLNYFSNHPTTHKKSTVIGLFYRSLKLSNINFRIDNIKKVKSILINNNYPVHFINKNLKIAVHKLYNNNINKNPNIKYVSIPYIKHLSENINNIFKKHNIYVAFKPYNTLRNLIFSNLKDKINKSDNSNVIYQINCNNCNGIYIGTTKQYLKKRIAQHKNSIKNNTNKTALSEHALNLFHNFDFNNVKILDKENNENKRYILEMLHIKTNNTSVNYKTDYQNLNNIYNNIL